MDKESFWNMIKILSIIFIMCFFIYGISRFVYSIDIDYNEDCMREMAINHCESEGMYFKKYFSGSFDSEYFICREIGRGMPGRSFDYSSEEMDKCRIKDANSLKLYKSKWELFESSKQDDILGANE